MENTKILLTTFEKQLNDLYEKFKSEYVSKINTRTGIEVKLGWISALSDRLMNEVMNLSIAFVKKNKIANSVTIDKVVQLNQRYIQKFNDLVNG